MQKFITVAFAILTVAAASNFEYFDNGLEYDISSNIISPLPFPYRDGFRSHTLNSEPSPSYVTLVAPEDHKTELVSSKSSLVASFASHVICYANLAVSFLTKNFSALILGSSVALGICKQTSLCSQGDTLLLLQREIRSLATPQRIKRATKIVQSAIQKYKAMP